MPSQQCQLRNCKRDKNGIVRRKLCHHNTAPDGYLRHSTNHRRAQRQAKVESCWSKHPKQETIDQHEDVDFIAFVVGTVLLELDGRHVRRMNTVDVLRQLA